MAPGGISSGRRPRLSPRPVARWTSRTGSPRLRDTCRKPPPLELGDGFGGGRRAVVEVVGGGEVVVVVSGAGSEVVVERAVVGGAVVGCSAVVSSPQAVATMDSTDSRRIGRQAGKRWLVRPITSKGIGRVTYRAELSATRWVEWDRVKPNTPPLGNAGAAYCPVTEIAGDLPCIYET